MPGQMETYDLDWDPITAEGFNKKTNEAILVFNFDITKTDKRNNVIQYVVGRAVWACKNFPVGATIRLSFDVRGQGIILSRSCEFKAQILNFITPLDLSNLIIIDFLM